MERATEGNESSAGKPTAGTDATYGDIREVVREGYGKIAERSQESPASGCGCCGGGSATTFATGLGYSADDLAAIPKGANLGLSCGNPTAMAALKPGDVVVDLGSGAGLDVFIAARRIAPGGRAIGVDMTPEMIARARASARKGEFDNVEFRLGEIENLPLADNSADVVISNCVINLSPDKGQVFREIARVLRPGGRVAVSDMALLRPLPAELRDNVEAYVGCVSGAVPIEEYTGHMRDAGLTEISVEPETSGDPLADIQDPLYQNVQERLPAGARMSDFVASVKVTARKP